MKTPRKKSSGAGGPDHLWAKIKSVSEIAATCRRKTSPETVLKDALRSTQKILHFDAATLFMLDPDKGELKQVAVLGGEVAPLSFLSLGKGSGLAGWTADHREPVLLANRSAKSSFDPQQEYATFLSVPLVAADGVIGVLNMGCATENAYDENDISLLTLIADHLAFSLERLHYQGETARLEKALDEARLALGRAEHDLTGLEQLKGMDELAAHINHEINNPLAVIVGNVQCLLLEKEATTQKALSRLKRIESAAVRIGEVNQRLVHVYALLSQTHAVASEKTAAG